ncbi:Protein of unknown function [Bacillus cereus]|uniref:Uncharacterized protein n=1 Tax=Bacillus wiedmannii TaxID=1890302 RepID=A0AB37YSK7_9BACI|nr:Protein of unknown function [Bacillus wiedmannii]SCC48944.1 Protein of unknown function [Bacillus cereus]SCN36024.1 Protein of unknown function [Bacillus wiedmannii]
MTILLVANKNSSLL